MYRPRIVACVVKTIDTGRFRRRTSGIARPPIHSWKCATIGAAAFDQFCFAYAVRCSAKACSSRVVASANVTTGSISPSCDGNSMRWWSQYRYFASFSRSCPCQCSISITRGRPGTIHRP